MKIIMLIVIAVILICIWKRQAIGLFFGNFLEYLASHDSDYCSNIHRYNTNHDKNYGSYDGFIRPGIPDLPDDDEYEIPPAK